MDPFGAVLGSGPSSLMSLGISFATGGVAGLGMELAKMTISQVAQNAARELGLPPEMTNMLIEGIESTLGPGLPGNPQTNEGISDYISDALGIPLNDVQQLVSSMDDLMSEIMSNFAEDELENGRERAGASGGSGAGGRISWIMTMAQKLGDVVDKQFMEMDKQMDVVSDLQGTESDSLPSETILMQAEVQEFNMLMQMSNNAIKTGGQAGSTMAGRS